ncbi:MAG: NTP transferase domain-containing protein [bacterium]
MLALIIAAGMGNRLGNLTSQKPKALVSVGGRELILRALDFVDHPAITERIVVTGYEGVQLTKFLSERRPDVHTVHNARYKDGSIITIKTALPHVNGDFLLMNTDHIYPRRMLDHILARARGITAVCDFDRELGQDDMKVKLTESRRLVGIRKTLTDFDGGYIGMTVCSSAMLPAYRDGVATAYEACGDAASAEAALAMLAGNKTSINICDASGMPWLEVDTQEDLRHAETALRQNPSFLL